MADGFGLTASPAGFVSLVCQVIAGIDTLRDIKKCARKAPTELSSLTDELTCLKCLVEEIADKAPSDDHCLTRLCYNSCEKVLAGLEKLKKRLPLELEAIGKRKVLEIFAFRRWKEDVEVLQESIRDAKMNLILYYSSVSREITLVNQTHNSSSPPVSLSEEHPFTVPLLRTNPVSFPSNEAGVDSQAIACMRPSQYTRRQWNCGERNCSCSCHRTTRTKRRFWAYEFSSPKLFRQTCDNKSCTVTKYGATFSFALSQLGIPWSAVIQFHVLAGAGKFSFRPAFDVEQIVPYTAPGFEVLWRCQKHLITVEEARDRLIALYRSDPTFKNHVNPGGESYIEELLRAPWGGLMNISKQYTLLELFIKEFRMTRGMQSTKFLARCAMWVGEGLHLELLEILLDLGLDPTIIDSPQAQDWRDPSLPIWRAQESAPDPFFVEYQSKLLKDNQGFAGMTPLHEAVLLESSDSVNYWISRSEKDDRNFLGQTPIHFAVSNVSHLLALVEAGHDLDAKDSYGITPLMYAAAANQETSVIALLGASANPLLQETRYKRTFMQYAAIRGHWTLILNTLRFMEGLPDKEVTEIWAQFATTLYFVDYPNYFKDREVSLRQLLAMCGSVDFTFDNSHKRLPENNNLMHFVRSVKDVEVLLELGFTLVNHVNSAGQHALMSSVLNQWEPEVVRKLLDAGAEIDLKDNMHHTTLFYVLNELRIFSGTMTWGTMEVLHILLANGIDVLCKDGCKCPCSPDGCFPSSLLSSVCEYYISTRVPVWSMEWLSLVLEHRGISEAREILLAFVRKAKFDEMGMTHVCCNRYRDGLSQFFLTPPLCDEDIDDIIEEEYEFVEILENEMALTSATDYDSVLDDWMLQIRASLERCCEEAIESNKHHALTKFPKQEMYAYAVDRKNDCFTQTLCLSMIRDPKGEVISDIAQYILWMEHEYYHGNISALEKTRKDSWYFSRFSWLYRLVNALEISTTGLADSMKHLCRFNKDTKYGPINVEESIKHFLASWMLREDNSVSSVGKVEIPLSR